MLSSSSVANKTIKTSSSGRCSFMTRLQDVDELHPIIIHYHYNIYILNIGIIKFQMISWWRSSWLLTRPVTLKSWTHRDLPCRMVMLGSSKDLIWDLWEYWGWMVGPSQIRLAPDWINWTNWAPGQSAMARPQPIRFLVNQNQEGPLVNTKWMFIPKNICVKGHIGTYIWTKWWPVSESVATPWSLSFLSWLFSLLQTKKCSIVQYAQHWPRSAPLPSRWTAA